MHLRNMKDYINQHLVNVTTKMRIVIQKIQIMWKLWFNLFPICFNLIAVWPKDFQFYASLFCHQMLAHSALHAVIFNSKDQNYSINTSDYLILMQSFQSFTQTFIFFQCVVLCLKMENIKRKPHFLNNVRTVVCSLINVHF